MGKVIGQNIQFQMAGDIPVFRPTGQVSLEQAVQLVTSAITHARGHSFAKLLIDVSVLTGFAPPSITQRYFFVQEWARASRGNVRIALVARKEMIDPNKFGVTVAANFGLVADVFISEEEALAWLRKDE